MVGVDSLNDAYDPRLKHWRLARLQPRKNFRFEHLDISDRAALAWSDDNKRVFFGMKE